MTRGERVAFGGRLEAAKRAGHRGTKNRRGDFTLDELRREARAESDGGAGVDREIASGAERGTAERSVRDLEGDALEDVFSDIDGAALLIGEHVVKLRTARWLLRTGEDVLVTREDDATGEVRGILRGRTVTQATVRRRDGALALEFDDDPYGEALEFVVRAPRRDECWELHAPDGTHARATNRGLTTHG